MCGDFIIGIVEYMWIIELKIVFLCGVVIEFGVVFVYVFYGEDKISDVLVNG